MTTTVAYRITNTAPATTERGVLSRLAYMKAMFCNAFDSQGFRAAQTSVAAVAGFPSPVKSGTYYERKIQSASHNGERFVVFGGH